MDRTICTVQYIFGRSSEKHLMENKLIYNKKNVIYKYSIHIFDLTRCFLSTLLLQSLNRSHVGCHFPPESNDDSLPWLLSSSFFYGVGVVNDSADIVSENYFTLEKVKN